MPTWSPITTPKQLPNVGDAEQTWLDFKVRVATANRYELAKDVAAFANASGGTLVVGAADASDRLSAYRPLTKDEARETAKAYEEATRDRVTPLPVIQIEILPYGDGYVVTVNVHPFPGQGVGVAIKKGDNGNDKEDLFHYPFRVGTQTKFITPGLLPMFTDARIRRIAILLEQATGSNVEIYVHPRPWESNESKRLTGNVSRVDVPTNTLELGYLNGGKNIKVPLDLVEAVCDGYGGWQVFLDGYLDEIGSDLRLMPSNVGRKGR